MSFKSGCMAKANGTTVQQTAVVTHTLNQWLASIQSVMQRIFCGHRRIHKIHKFELPRCLCEFHGFPMIDANLIISARIPIFCVTSTVALKTSAVKTYTSVYNVPY